MPGAGAPRMQKLQERQLSQASLAVNARSRQTMFEQTWDSTNRRRKYWRDCVNHIMAHLAHRNRIWKINHDFDYILYRRQNLPSGNHASTVESESGGQ
jgi:hypothetical protein